DSAGLTCGGARLGCARGQGGRREGKETSSGRSIMRSRADAAALTVRELMCPDVATISADASVRELTELLSYHGITGVPVVDGTGAVMGVVTATDVVRLAARMGDSPARSAAAQLGPERSEYFASVRVTPQLLRRLRPGVLDDHSVVEIMMPATFSVGE